MEVLTGDALGIIDGVEFLKGCLEGEFSFIVVNLEGFRVVVFRSRGVAIGSSFVDVYDRADEDGLRFIAG